MIACRSILSAALVALTSTVVPIETAHASNRVTHTTTTVNGLSVIRFVWTDSQGLRRSVSIKEEGNGNPGHGGYAVQMTYQASVANVLKTIVVNPAEDGEGFGYFVSHERYRSFSDGDYDTIAHKVFHVDDSPLGRGIAASLTIPTPNDPSEGSIVVSTTYHHYGTIDPIAKDATGEDVRPTPTSISKLTNYQIPVTITWTFQSGKDYPVVRTSVDISAIGPDRVNFDVRGPYGAMYFNRDQATIDTVMWGDRYLFANTATPLTRNSSWRWRTTNPGARYTALIANGYEMGLFEPHPFAQSRLAGAYANGRHKTSSTYTCRSQKEILPCDYEWPYQSAQYSLPYDDNNAPTNYPKIAWGSSPYYGTGPSLSTVYDTSKTSEPFNGDPGVITYDICIVLGQTISGGLTAQASSSAASYNCAAP